MKLLFAHWGPTDADVAMNRRIAACAPEEMQIQCVIGSMPPPKAKLPWPELDHAWKRRDPSLMRFYETIGNAAAECDVLMLWNGWNLHPEFVASLPTFNVYCCVDDPESSDKQSRPLAPAFDGVLYGNIASGTQYASWGCRRIAHLPIFVDPNMLPDPTDQSVLAGERNNDIVLCCGQNKWRQQRLSRLAGAFAQARCYGHRWNTGYISDDDLRDLYRRTRIGWNVHNSTGPINQRLFMLAAWGIMPLCDNLTGLGQLFDLGREAIGFDTVDEGIDATRYYLEHEDERRHIAEAAYRRFWRDYHAKAIWQRVYDQVTAWQAQLKSEADVAERSVQAVDLSPSAATSGQLASNISQAIARRSQRLRTAIERLRYGVSSADLDERMYLREPVAYRPGVRARNPKTANQHDTEGFGGDPHHRTALAWALTSLIGGAKRIRVVGDFADTFAELASLESGRQVAVAADVREAVHEADDLIVVAASVNDLNDLLTFPGDPGRPGSRWILVCRELTSAKVCDQVYKQLSESFQSVRFSFLSDPYVPWLDPLDGMARVEPLIAMCDD